MDKAKWWKISNFISFLFIVIIGLLWFDTTKKYKPNINQLTNQAEVEQYLSDRYPNLPQKRIPTAVFIQSLNFNSSSQVNLTGYISQIHAQSKYKGIPGEEIPVGFIFPEAVESGSNIEPKFAYREQIKDNKEVIVWYFEATLKQKFDYSKYPFDHKTVWIRFWSKDFLRKTILVPDFSSYKSTKVDDAFGYDENIVLGQWQLLETFFDFHQEDYNTHFGTYGKAYQNNQPELYFNIVIKRRFLNSFVVYIIPLLTIASLAFATLLMMTKDEKQASTHGINTSGVIGVCSGLFFLVLLSQVQIREQFAGSNIVYLEFLYPIMNITLLGVAANSYIFSHKNTEKYLAFRWIHYEDNLIPKLLYWPVLLGSVTIMSAVVLLPEYQHKSHPQEQSFLLDDRYSSEATTLLPFDLDLDLDLEGKKLAIAPEPIEFSRRERLPRLASPVIIRTNLQRPLVGSFS